MKYFKKKSRSFYVFLACALLLSAVTPDRYTNKLHAELATLSSASLTIRGLVLSVDWASLGATCLFVLGAWGLSQKKNEITSNTSSSNQPAMPATRVEQEVLLSIGLDTQIAAPIIDHTQRLLHSVEPLADANLTLTTPDAHIGLDAEYRSASNLFQNNLVHQFARTKEITSSKAFSTVLVAGLSLRGFRNLYRAIKPATDTTAKKSSLPLNHDCIYDIEGIPQRYVNEALRTFGIYQHLTVDPLWATLSLKEKLYISESPIQVAVWNNYLTLRQQAFKQVVDTLGFTKEQVTHSVKKIIYEALSKGGILFSPLDRPDILAAAIQEASVSTQERVKLFSLLFAKNGVLTCISGAPELKKLKVGSSIFDPKHGNLLVGINQLGQFLKNSNTTLPSREVTFLTSLLQSTLKGVPHQDF